MDFLNRFFRVDSIKFYVNLSSGGLVDTCGQGDGRTNMTKLIGAFCYYVNAPNRRIIFFIFYYF